MNRAAALLLLLASAAPGKGLALVGIREEMRPVPDAAPPRMEVAFDFLTPAGAAATRRVTILDGPMALGLLRDPFVYPQDRDHAFLVARDPEGWRCLRLSWKSGESTGVSFVVPDDPDAPLEGRPIRVLEDRFALLDARGARFLDLRVPRAARVPLASRPIDLHVVTKRLFVARADAESIAVHYHAMDPCDPLPAVGDAAKPLLRIPERGDPERGAVSPDQLKAACALALPASRPDAWRFLLVVADARERPLVRRTFAGRVHDLRFLDDERLLAVATHGETTLLHVVEVRTSAVRSTALPDVYVAPPEVVAADLLPAPAEN